MFDTLFLHSTCEWTLPKVYIYILTQHWCLLPPSIPKQKLGLALAGFIGVLEVYGSIDLQH